MRGGGFFLKLGNRTFPEILKQWKVSTAKAVGDENSGKPSFGRNPENRPHNGYRQGPNCRQSHTKTCRPTSSNVPSPRFVAQEVGMLSLVTKNVPSSRRINNPAERDASCPADVCRGQSRGFNGWTSSKKVPVAACSGTAWARQSLENISGGMAVTTRKCDRCFSFCDSPAKKKRCEVKVSSEA